MKNLKKFDVIIVGGSYSGLAAGMALGRSLKKVLIIDSGKPCNRQTPYSHNFLTQDGKTPKEIAQVAKLQVEHYKTVHFVEGLATSGKKTKNGFQIEIDSGKSFESKKLIFATGIRDIMPQIKGFAECWGISVLHCPYCHGYEVRHQKTGILGNGEYGYEFSRLISNWTDGLALFTNGKSTLSKDETQKLMDKGIKIIESEIAELQHIEGHLKQLIFKDGSIAPLKALYAHIPFEQHCPIPESLGCELTEEGYIKIDGQQMTSVDGVYACGDNTTRMRTVSNAVAMGATTGMLLNKKMVLDEF
ncbi:NAD(P)/FAD-dependent oxidoreductase [Muricauda sp. CAU 1633]|uniref:NAD(P)/FAD-dependent oxidoreductase n=1 Tax=Allomuricauda sp. CAU 1633 TaxID=2816036 RepID=UPI001A900332|nr:NAD(P)/FAD-dependent oxidoreductase [Muricauda sp. CAU 1633]MBO0321587.1 NAD(P)/FAD-dependent oxidoreductase [Muricauda sp. CAU 1633]